MGIVEERTVPQDDPGLSIQKSKEGRVRLEFLDGLRGLCALYVVLHHVRVEADWHGRLQMLPPAMQSILHLFDYGRFAVTIFIVLSGYCLMLPVARSADGALRGGFWDYLRRRARRILPPYYAALALALLMFALVPGMQHETGIFTITALPYPDAAVTPTIGVGVMPRFTAGTILTHLFLVHNLSDRWIFKINPPMWSVATEWEIYFLFPLILLPLWRRFGITTMLVGAYILGLLPHYLFHHQLDLAVPYYIGLFAFGMAGATLGFSQKPEHIRFRERVPWGVLTLIFTTIFVGMTTFERAGQTHWGYLEPLAGATAIFLIIYCVRNITQIDSKRPAILRFLESRWPVWLGAFSYSLYLVHYPILALAHAAVIWQRWSPMVEFWMMLFVVAPLTVCLAYLFHLAFEKRFMSTSSGRQTLLENARAEFKEA